MAVLAGLLGLLGVMSLAFATPAMATGTTNAGDDLRTGWYPDESAITPQLVSSATFGQLWSAPVDGQVYAQPLLSPTGTLIVATENDKVYGLDPASGHQLWMVDEGTPWNPADIGCSDIVPSVGTTSTPVIDSSTHTVYLTYKTYDAAHNAAWFMDARDVDSGQRRAGFPVQLSGTADNAAVTFFPRTQQQRPGLLLMNGVVYAGFGSHCDAQPFQGWIFGVSTTTHQITTRWVDDNDSNGAGIWQAGVGLTSDAPGSILFATGNGGSPSAAAPGSSPPASCGECVMRLHVQPDGSLAPVDFFAPFDANQLDDFDADFGSGGVVGLPDQYFGTSSVPHLAVAVGKEGYVYLLNRDDLGGYEQGAGGGDDVVQRVGPNGGVWGRAGVWPGDGGYVYIATSTGQTGGGLFDVYKYGLDGSGNPSLSLANPNDTDVFGWGTGSPVITSDGTTSGSALVWIIWSANRQGNGGELRAYNAVPVDGQLGPPLFRAPIGNATNYSTPGVGAGRIYVGTRDGQVLAFGSPVTQPLSGSALSFPRTTIGSSSTATETLTANANLTISSLASSDPGEFQVGTPSQPLPATLSAGETISIPVTFVPSQTGPIGAQLTAGTDAGNVSFSLSGAGQVAGPKLAVSPGHLSLGGSEVGGHLSGTVTLSDVGSQPLTIQAVTPPSTPFTATGLPTTPYTLNSGAAITVGISFDPTSTGLYNDVLVVDTNGGNQEVGLSASAGTPGHLQFSREAIDFGSVQVDASASQTFTITNTGGTAVTINKSKPPFGGAFAATTSLPEGTTIAPGQTLTESVTFSPTAAGAASGVWQINGDDGTGLHQVQFTGSGATPSGSGSPRGSGSAPGAQKASMPIAPRFLPGVATTAHLAGIYITYTAKRAGVTRFVLQRATAGRRGAHGCVAATARNRSLPACIRFVTVRSFSHRGHAGTNRLRLGAFVALRKLVAGRYRLVSILLDSAGGKHTFQTPLRIVLTPRHAPARRAAPMITVLADLLRRVAAAI